MRARYSIGLFILLLVLTAVARSITGTVDTPAVATWVDGSGNSITPYVTLGPSNALYIDSTTGYVWTIQDILTNPTAVGQSLQGVHFTTVNCTGTVYLLEPTFDLPKLVHTGSSAGNYYVAVSPAAVTTNSQLLNGTCYADVETSDLYNSAGPLTAPTLTAAPWHLEAR